MKALNDASQKTADKKTVKSKTLLKNVKDYKRLQKAEENREI